MADKPFVINDRRRFSSEGDVRPDAPPREEVKREPAPAPAEETVEATKGPQLVTEQAPLSITDEGVGQPLEGPTAEQSEQALKAYNATVERLDTAVRAMNPGTEHLPPMTFERLVQSLYMQALIQLGGSPEPGQPVQVDLMGAKSTIEMLTVVSEKVQGNLSESETRLLASALFEIRMGFLEVTQMLARQAAQQRGEGGPGMPPPPGGAPFGGGPSIVR
jgi:hypothetical protein